MSEFHAYTVELLDRTPVRSFMALHIQAERLVEQRRRMVVSDTAYGVRVGMAESEQYAKAIRRINRPYRRSRRDG